MAPGPSRPAREAACLAIIDGGTDLEKWAASPVRGKRAKVLAGLREMIASPPPPAKPMPKPLPVQLPGWEFGEVVFYLMANGKCAALHVLNYRAGSVIGVRAPVVSILNWFSDTRPDQDSIDGLTFINHDGMMVGGHHLVCLAMPRREALVAAQFDRPGWSKPVTGGEATSAVYGLSGHEGGDIEKTLTRVLSPYWEDPRPAHVPKQFPPETNSAETPPPVRRVDPPAVRREPASAIAPPGIGRLRLRPVKVESPLVSPWPGLTRPTRS